MRYELAIIGAGAAGFAAAIKANELEAETLLVNSGLPLGGTCVNVGCMPTKHLLGVAEALHRARRYCFLEADFGRIMREKERIISELREEKYEKVLNSLSFVDFARGRARVEDEHTLSVEGERHRAEKIIIATGASPAVPPVEGISVVDYLTNLSALALAALPESLLILGGGPQGVEFAQIFARLGAEVTLLNRGERILRREEPELARMLQGYLEEEGIRVVNSASAVKVEQGREVVVRAEVEGKPRTFYAEKLLLATGRKPNVPEGAERYIKLGKRGEVLVDSYMRAGRSFFAAGDVTGEPMLETVAAREGMVAATNALSQEKLEMDYSLVPHAVFTSPALAGIGMTDEQALARGIRCRCNTVPLALVPRARASGEARGAVKMVVEEGGKILGVHVLGDRADDIIHEAVMILKNRMSVDDVIETLHVFPTLSEAVKLAAQSFRRDITRMSCCVE